MIEIMIKKEGVMNFIKSIFNTVVLSGVLLTAAGCEDEPLEPGPSPKSDSLKTDTFHVEKKIVVNPILPQLELRPEPRQVDTLFVTAGYGVLHESRLTDHFSANMNRNQAANSYVTGELRASGGQQISLKLPKVASRVDRDFAGAYHSIYSTRKLDSCAVYINSVDGKNVATFVGKDNVTGRPDSAQAPVVVIRFNKELSVENTATAGTKKDFRFNPGTMKTSTGTLKTK